MMIKIKIKNKLEGNNNFFIEWWNKKNFNKRIKKSKEDPIIKNNIPWIWIEEKN